MKFTQENFKQFEKVIREKCLVGDHPVFNSELFEWVKILEDNFELILEEYQKFIDRVSQENLMSIHEYSEVQTPLSSDDKWKVIPLILFNEVNVVTTSLMPKTFSIINNIPVITTCFFSILHPGKYIPPHRGYYGGVLRCHLPVKVPRDASNCWIRIDKTKYSWQLGKALIFDDTYEHEVHNDTNETRVVLFIDFMRPLPADLAAENRTAVEYFQHTDFVKNPMSQYEKWESKYLSASATNLSR
jgi:aspartyl/asparaginyl beta-hydroxylase (cupin superfamily)